MLVNVREIRQTYNLKDADPGLYKHPAGSYVLIPDNQPRIPSPKILHITPGGVVSIIDIPCTSAEYEFVAANYNLQLIRKED